MVPLDGDSARRRAPRARRASRSPARCSATHASTSWQAGEELQSRLPAKNRHNRDTMTLFLLVAAGDTLCRRRHLVAWPSTATTGSGLSGRAAASVASLTFSISYSQCWSSGRSPAFRSLRPQFCSIYDPYYWWHERFWKLGAGTYRPVQRHPAEEPASGGCSACASAAGSSTTAAASPRRLWSTIGDDFVAQRRHRDPVPLARGRRLQVRPHRHRPGCDAWRRRRSSTTA